jgi:tetratricopeptide (TPR) repeat protein
MWKEAAGLKVHPPDFPWGEYPWQKAIVHFTRLLGAVHIGHLDSARIELKYLHKIHDRLLQLKDSYKANQVNIQIKAAEAWILFKEGKTGEAVKLMKVAANMESNTQKHSVTPGEVLPAGELLADMLLAANQSAEALEAYELDLKDHPNRFNGLYGAGLAAERSGNPGRASVFYRQLITIAGSANSNRAELNAAKLFLRNRP